MLSRGAKQLERIPLVQSGESKLSEVVGVYVTREADLSRRLACEVHTAARRDPRVFRLLDGFNRRVRAAPGARIAERGGDGVGSAEMTADLLFVLVLGLAHLDTLAPERRGRPAFRAVVEAAVERILG